jgi:large subunit ribosomal protein L4
MAQVTVFTAKGKESGSVSVADQLFAVEPNINLLHEVVRIQDANSRRILGTTKDRSEVRGGGRKPWKQKGTGRARHGSRRSPIWSGGGITFGPNLLRNFKLKVNKKVRRKAIAMALSDRLNDKKFMVIDTFGADAKTSELKGMLSALSVADEKVLLITTKEDTGVIRAAKNLPRVKTISAQSLNAKDLLLSNVHIASKAAVEKIQETYLA